MSSDTSSGNPRSGTVVRWILAGPLALIGAIVAMAVTPLWMPHGAGGVDHLVFAIVLFPLYWAALFFYAVLAERLGHVALFLGRAVLLRRAGRASRPRRAVLRRLAGRVGIPAVAGLCQLSDRMSDRN